MTRDRPMPRHCRAMFSLLFRSCQFYRGGLINLQQLVGSGELCNFRVKPPFLYFSPDAVPVCDNAFTNFRVLLVSSVPFRDKLEVVNALILL